MRIPHLIVGGGLAGTTIAVSLLKRGGDFLLIESTSQLGGKIETLITDEALYEFGPNSYTNQCEEIFQFLKMLGLYSEVLEASKTSRNRYILKNGTIVRLPKGPQELLTTKSLSLKGRLRFLLEFFYVPKRKVEEESVQEFFARHFGREVADNFADPFVSGIYAGDATKLSLKEAFPTMAEAEASSKSLIRYLIKQRKTTKATPKTYQLSHGLQSIFHRALEMIGSGKIHFSEKVIEIDPKGKTTRILTERGEYETAHLYLTAPACVTTKCFERTNPEISKALGSIQYAPVVTVHVRVSKQEAYPFDGFGILIPSSERRRILGVLWNSSTFPSLFPDKQNHYLTVFVGGAHRAELVHEDESVIKKIVSDEVKDLFALKSDPSIIGVRCYEKAIPQFVMGYGKILESLQRSQEHHSSLKFAGNYMSGISIPKTVAYALKVA